MTIWQVAGWQTLLSGSKIYLEMSGGTWLELDPALWIVITAVFLQQILSYQ